MFLFGLTTYTYLTKKGGLLAGTKREGHAKATLGDELKNGMVFAWGFLELATWFWVYLLLREERRQVAMKLMEQRKREEEIRLQR